LYEVGGTLAALDAGVLLFGIHTSMKNGGTVGLLRASKVLSKVQSVLNSDGGSEVLLATKNYQANFESTTLEFGNGVDTINTIVTKAVDDVDKFMALHKNVTPAIEAWSFADTPLLTGAKAPTLEEGNLSTSLRTSLQHQEGWCTQITSAWNLVKGCKSSDVPKLNTLQALVEAFDGYVTKFRDGAFHLAKVLLTHNILTGSTVEKTQGCRNYCEKTLKAEFGNLPKELQTRYAAHTSTAASASAEAVAVVASGEASAGLGLAVDTVPPPAKKKLRRLV